MGAIRAAPRRAATGGPGGQGRREQEQRIARRERPAWETAVEYSFNDYGDRGSVDILGWQPEARALLIVETKSDLRNVQETLHALDVKLRVVPRLVRAERGWRAAAVGVVMVLADVRAERQRVDRHRSTFDAALPARTVEVRRWLERPAGPLRGLSFLQVSQPKGAMREPAGRCRVRRAVGPAGPIVNGCGQGGWRSDRGSAALRGGPKPDAEGERAART